jgi:hypothetical protein
MTLRHFLCLKILWKRSDAGKFQLHRYVDQRAIKKAEELIKKPKCKAFFDNIGSKKYPDDSIFSLVHLYMDLVFKVNAATTSFGSPKVLLTPLPVRGRHQRERTPESPLTGRDSTPSDVEMRTPPNPAKSRRGTQRRLSFLDREDPRMDADMPEMQGNLSEASPSASHVSDSTAEGPDGLSPAHPSEFTPSEDEILVNMAFVLLLNALTEPDGTMRSKGYRWLPNREAVKIFNSLPASGAGGTVVGNKAADKLLEARTDGCLRHTEHNLSAALVEVKPCVREQNLERIQWQEGVQMAAYIYKLLYTDRPANEKFGLLRCDKAGVRR